MAYYLGSGVFKIINFSTLIQINSVLWIKTALNKVIFTWYSISLQHIYERFTRDLSKIISWKYVFLLEIQCLWKGYNICQVNSKKLKFVWHFLMCSLQHRKKIMFSRWAMFFTHTFVRIITIVSRFLAFITFLTLYCIVCLNYFKNIAYTVKLEAWIERIKYLKLWILKI